MTRNEARGLILTRIATLGLPTDFGGVNMTEEVNTNTPTDVVWIRPVINFNAGAQESIGGPNVATRHSDAGVIIIQVFSSLGLGLDQGDDAAQRLTSLFRAQSDAGIRYYDVGVRDIGRDENWWQSNVSISFSFDSTCVTI